MRIENRMQLQLWREECKEKRQKENCCILVCGGTGCLAGGSDKIYARLKELTSNMDHVTVKIGEEIAHVGLKMSGCHGFCEMGPLVRIEPYNYLYLKVKLEDCEEIFEKTILHGEPVTRLMYEDNGHVYQTQEEIPFYAKQTRLVLRNCGHIDAEHIEDAMAVGAYESFEKAVFEMTPEAVIKTVTDAGLRGRGGAGFPAGRKWSQVASQPEKIRYVVCNGDEGDPGAFMDRSVMEGDPHRMIEGMMLAAYAVQAQEGYIYVRAEYPLAVRRLQIAIAQAEEKGLLGDNILGTGFSFKLHINRGAGAFVCGEGSALTASIEGKRGMPRVKPPRTVEQGLWEKPTVLNNVETYANIPMIIKNGADWYSRIGTPQSPGTKAFALTGNVKNTGLQLKLMAFKAAALKREKALLKKGGKKCSRCGAVINGKGNLCAVCSRYEQEKLHDELVKFLLTEPWSDYENCKKTLNCDKILYDSVKNHLRQHYYAKVADETASGSEKMLAVIFKTGKTPDLIDDKTYQNVLNNLRGK